MSDVNDRPEGKGRTQLLEEIKRLEGRAPAMKIEYSGNGRYELSMDGRQVSSGSLEAVNAARRLMAGEDVKAVVESELERMQGVVCKVHLGHFRAVSERVKMGEDQIGTTCPWCSMSRLQLELNAKRALVGEDVAVCTQHDPTKNTTVRCPWCSLINVQRALQESREQYSELMAQVIKLKRVLGVGTASVEANDLLRGMKPT